MRKTKKEYSNDELGELIIPKKLTEEDRKIFREAIIAHNKKLELSTRRKSQSRSRQRKVTIPH
jgi:hypothetical protein